VLVDHYEKIFSSIKLTRNWNELGTVLLMMVDKIHSIMVKGYEEGGKEFSALLLIVVRVSLSQICKGDISDFEIVKARILNEWETNLKPVVEDFVKNNKVENNKE